MNHSTSDSGMTRVVTSTTSSTAKPEMTHRCVQTNYSLFRCLAPGHPDYKPQYYGDLRSRDAAYHQGTVWAWLIGPFIDAWLKVYPDDFGQAQKFLAGFQAFGRGLHRFYQ
jgi:hypothetical protein